MDPYARAAFGRIQLFLADLNHVIGYLPIGPIAQLHHPFDQVGLQPSLRPDVLNMAVCRGRPTRRSKSWRKKHFQPVLHRPRQSSPTRLPVYSPKQRVHTRDNVMIPKPETQPAIPLDVQPDDQAAPFFIPNSVPIQLDAHDSTNQCLSNYNECLNDDATDPSGPHLLANEHDPEDKQDPHLLENKHDTEEQYDPHLLVDEQEPDDPPVREPVFDMKNYSAKDVNRWASTLTADEFEELRHQGKEAWFDAFRQYVTSDFDQPALTSPQPSSSPHDIEHQQRSATNNCPEHHPFHPTSDSHEHPHYPSDIIEGIDDPNHLDYNESFHGTQAFESNGGYNDIDNAGGNQAFESDDGYNDINDAGGNQAFESDGGYNDIDDAGGEFNDHGNLEDVWNDHLDYGNDFDGSDGFDNGGYEDYDDSCSDVFDGDGFIYH